MVMLMVSELSEAIEAARNDLPDDKLPQFSGYDVELVDCFIRMFDDFGSRDVCIDEILEAKLAYNRNRPYKHGKTY